LRVINSRLNDSKRSIGHSVVGTLALDSKERVGAGGWWFESYLD